MMLAPGALEELIAAGFERQPSLPPLVTEAIAGATFTLIYKRLRESGPGSLPTLAPMLTYITLSPFIGAEEACRVANGDGRGRPTSPTGRSQDPVA